MLTEKLKSLIGIAEQIEVNALLKVVSLPAVYNCRLIDKAELHITNVLTVEVSDDKHPEFEKGKIIELNLSNGWLIEIIPI